MCTILIENRSNKNFLEKIVEELQDKDDKVLLTASRKETEQKIRKQKRIDLIICDLDIVQWEKDKAIIRLFKQYFPQGQFLGALLNEFITYSYDDIIRLIKTGVDDFWPHSDNQEKLRAKINQLKKIADKTPKSDPLTNVLTPQNIIIGNSPAIQNVLEKLKIIAAHEAESCLIYGESGTGKELAAKMIHHFSPRKHKPFVALNCAGTPESLIDSEFFGFEKGSFTGADHASQGKFELANGGVLFLDEISEMPVHLQGKLLRALENREIVRIGGKKTLPLDVMVVASTNRDLLKKIDDGSFREDVYYRLNMVKIELPPLRERVEDIPLLANHFLNHFEPKSGPRPTLSDKAISALKAYHFPGNIRELRNIIYHTALFCKSGEISEKDIETYLEKNARKKKPVLNGKQPRASKEEILELLEKNGGNITQTAKALGYTREGLSRKIKKWQ